MKKTLAQRIGLSNSAHQRLMKKHEKMSKKTSGKIRTEHIRKHNYHGWVISNQLDENVILDEQYRKDLFKHVVSNKLVK